MHPRFLLALTPLLFTTVAHAVDCANANDQGTMNQCAAEQYKAADKELNTLYQQITKRLKDNPDAKKLLVSAQRNWVAFRDAECEFFDLYGVGWQCVSADLQLVHHQPDQGARRNLQSLPHV